MADETVGLKLQVEGAESALKTAQAVEKAEKAVYEFADTYELVQTKAEKARAAVESFIPAIEAENKALLEQRGILAQLATGDAVTSRSTTIGLSGGTADASAKTVAYAQALRSAGGAARDSGRDFTHVAMTMMMLGQMADDAQYGLRSIVNNVGPLALSLGHVVGMGNPAAMALSAIAQVGIVAYANWDKVKGLFGWFEEFTSGESIPKMAAKLNELANPKIAAPTEGEMAKGISAYQKGAAAPDAAGQTEGKSAGNVIKALGGDLYQEVYKSLLGKMSEGQAQSNFSNGVSVAGMMQARATTLIERAQQGDPAAIKELESRSTSFRNQMFDQRQGTHADDAEKQREYWRSVLPDRTTQGRDWLSKEDRENLKAAYEELIENIRVWGRDSDQAAKAQRRINEYLDEAGKEHDADQAADAALESFNDSNERWERYTKTPKYAWRKAVSAAKRAGIQTMPGSTDEVERLLESSALSGEDEAYVRRRAGQLQAAATGQDAWKQMQALQMEWLENNDSAGARMMQSQMAANARMNDPNAVGNMAARQAALRMSGGGGSLRGAAERAAKNQQIAEKMQKASMTFEEAVKKLADGNIQVVM